jgi:ribosome-associated toxin RatA of RatAB toxin-antitoxin module
MNTINIIIAFIIGAGIGVSLAKIIRNGGVVRIHMRRRVTAPPAEIIDLISQVEREPELIPLVRSVEVMERRGDQVKYIAEFGLGFNVIQASYRKSWNVKKQKVNWQSESASHHLKHSGQIEFRTVDGVTYAHLITEYSFGIPVAGPLIAMLSEWAVVGALSTWLHRLNRDAIRSAQQQ